MITVNTEDTEVSNSCLLFESCSGAVSGVDEFEVA